MPDVAESLVRQALDGKITDGDRKTEAMREAAVRQTSRRSVPRIYLIVGRDDCRRACASGADGMHDLVARSVVDLVAWLVLDLVAGLAVGLLARIVRDLVARFVLDHVVRFVLDQVVRFVIDHIACIVLDHVVRIGLGLVLDEDVITSCASCSCWGSCSTSTRGSFSSSTMNAPSPRIRAVCSRRCANASIGALSGDSEGEKP
jgi:hypothetical protein